MCHAYKLQIVHNHVKLGEYSKDTLLAMGLADLLGIADLHYQKVKSIKWLKHELRATIGCQ